MVSKWLNAFLAIIMTAWSGGNAMSQDVSNHMQIIKTSLDAMIARTNEDSFIIL